MDNLRLFLWVGLGLLLWMTFQTWQADHAPVTTPPAEQAAAAPSGAGQPETPAPDDLLPELPETPATETAPQTGTAASPSSSPTVHVRTDVLDLKIGLRGGILQDSFLPAYPVHKDRPDEPVQLLNSDPRSLYLLQTGLRAGGDAVQIDSQTLFDSPADEYILADDQDELVVPLSWTSPDGVRVEKRFRFRRGRYDIELQQELINDSNRPYSAAAYLQIRRRYQPLKRTMFNVDSYSFNGPVAYDGEKYEKLKVKDLEEEPFEQTVSGGWMAAIQHHFLVAAIPPAERPYKYRILYDGEFFTESTIGAELVTVAPGSAEIFPAKLFVGPKLQKQLAETAEGLPLTVDYGLLTLLAQPLFWLLDKIHAVIGNWGWTIIIVTFLIKLAFYKLTETSGRSMAKMRKMQPRMKALQERYKDDREAMSRALMDLYKREKVNPAAGCLPMLIQVPFFMAFYWVLLESVEMRQAPFMLWITDLSSRDPYFILPLLMGAAMWFQQKLNPAPPDPMQAKVMMLMPVLFTGMFAFFPAGLVLYWLTNSLLSMLQQWRINKVIGAD